MHWAVFHINLVAARTARAANQQTMTMLISQKMNAAINEQIGSELAASMQYLAIAAGFASEGLPRLSALFRKQSSEERDHALKFVSYLIDAGGKVQFPPIPAPRHDFKTVEDAVAAALDWEKTVTGQINKLMDLASNESDYITQNFLGWFLNEQLEEVSSMDNLLKLVRRVGEKNIAFLESSLAGEAATPAASGQPDEA